MLEAFALTLPYAEFTVDRRGGQWTPWSSRHHLPNRRSASLAMSKDGSFPSRPRQSLDKRSDLAPHCKWAAEALKPRCAGEIVSPTDTLWPRELY